MTKVVCTHFRATGHAVYIRFNVFERAHHSLLDFVCDLEAWPSTETSKLDQDYENLEGLEVYELMEGEKYDVHCLAIGGKQGAIHLIVRVRSHRLKMDLVRKVKKHFVMNGIVDIEEGWTELFS